MDTRRWISIVKCVLWISAGLFILNLTVQHEVGFSLTPVQYTLGVLAFTSALIFLIYRIRKMALEGWPFNSETGSLKILMRVVPYIIAVFALLAIGFISNANFKASSNNMYNLGLSRLGNEPALQEKIGELKGYGFITAFYVNVSSSYDQSTNKMRKSYQEMYSCRVFGTKGAATANFIVGCLDDQPCQPVSYMLPD